MSKLNYVPTESPAPIYAWVILIILINAYWTFYDFVLCPHYRWEMMTTEVREGLNSALGCFIAGAVAFTVVTFIVHMWNIRVSA